MYYTAYLSTNPSERDWEVAEKRIDRKETHSRYPNRYLANCCGAVYKWPSEDISKRYIGFQVSENNLCPEYDTGKQRHVAVKTKAGVLNIVSYYG